MSILAGFGIFSFAILLIRYDYVHELVEEARLKADMAEQKWRGLSLSRDMVYKDVQIIINSNGKEIK